MKKLKLHSRRFPQNVYILNNFKKKKQLLNLSENTFETCFPL